LAASRASVWISRRRRPASALGGLIDELTGLQLGLFLQPPRRGAKLALGPPPQLLPRLRDPALGLGLGLPPRLLDPLGDAGLHGDDAFVGVAHGVGDSLLDLALDPGSPRVGLGDPLVRAVPGLGQLGAQTTDVGGELGDIVGARPLGRCSDGLGELVHLGGRARGGFLGLDGAQPRLRRRLGFWYGGLPLKVAILHRKVTSRA
jgi:hypothetical protein